jgi:DNA-binding Lrp family transcriptional regulator
MTYMDNEINEVKLGDLEYRVLQLLKENSRMPVSEIANELKVSRPTVSRIITSLQEKGIKFTVEYNEGVTAFVVTSKCPQDAECFELIDGNIMAVIHARDLNELEEELKKIKDEKKYLFLSHKKVGKVSVRVEMRCDYCGGAIRGSPLILKKGRKTYYACCKACLDGLKNKLK